jgi:Raf kinase inhibitor-like YbhB/YbcL family protein
MMRLLACGATLAAAMPASASAQQQEQETSNTEIVGHVLQPRKLEPTAERQSNLKLPENFKLEVFAEGLVNPRILAVADDGTLYATRRSVGDVVMLKDTNGDGKADVQKVVAGRPNMHGIAIDGDKAYLVTVHDVYVANIKKDGTFGELKRLVDDLPDAGQHNDRTIAVGPDGMLYVSVGSTCNACNEPNPENATMLQMKPDGSFRKIFASGLRNTIGFAFDPATGKLWGADHGIDWLGDDEQPEEINLIEQGKQYGWPYIFGDGGKNPQDRPPGGLTLDQWASASESPVLTYTAHAAPMQLAFYTGDQFPAEYRGDAFLAMHGSWNRKPPSGYEVVRIKFKDGKAQKIEPFITGFLTEKGGEYGYMGRPFGLAVAKDGSLFVGDDANGVIYRVSYAGPKTAQSEAPMQIDKVAANSASPEPKTPKQLAGDIVQANKSAKLDVTSSAFDDNGRIPERYSAYDQNFSPAIGWSKGPDGVKSYVLLMEDPDASTATPFVHWIAYNIPADVTRLDEGVPGTDALTKPEGARQGVNSRGSVGYFGPKPPADGDHHYHFQVFALDTTLDLKPGAGRKEVLDAMRGHVLAQGERVGLFRKPASANGA